MIGVLHGFLNANSNHRQAHVHTYVEANAAFTPAQQVARRKLRVARNKLRVARNMLLEATSCAQHATCCGQQATCCGQHTQLAAGNKQLVAGHKQQVAGNTQLVARNLLGWCKRGIKSLAFIGWILEYVFSLLKSLSQRPALSLTILSLTPSPR